MMVNSGEALFRASTFTACWGANNPRGLMQSDAATIGEISQPVAGSTARALGVIIDSVASVRVGGRVAALVPLAHRNFARSRSKWEKLPV